MALIFPIAILVGTPMMPATCVPCWLEGHGGCFERDQLFDRVPVDGALRLPVVGDELETFTSVLRVECAALGCDTLGQQLAHALVVDVVNVFVAAEDLADFGEVECFPDARLAPRLL